MKNGFADVGKSYDNTQDFIEHLETLKSDFWNNLKGVCIHHTGFPHLAMRPDGFTEQLIRNIQYGYENNLGWSTGPHLFVDDYKVWGMCPLDQRGIHAVSFNSRYIGIEALGDYNYKDDETSIRGSAVWDIVINATACILFVKGLDADDETIKFHRDDPKTNKTCPGKKISKGWFIAKVANRIKDLKKSSPELNKVASEKTAVETSENLAAIEYQIRALSDEIKLETPNLEEIQERAGHIIWRTKQALKDA
ncbi:peptidoglycan recognition protein family protein [Akkermansiaceae bacterium]|nr:peptidoglycan recognition protein family protein [Akkermansiaceae bacterium]